MRGAARRPPGLPRRARGGVGALVRSRNVRSTRAATDSATVAPACVRVTGARPRPPAARRARAASSCAAAFDRRRPRRPPTQPCGARARSDCARSRRGWAREASPIHPARRALRAPPGAADRCGRCPAPAPSALQHSAPRLIGRPAARDGTPARRGGHGTPSFASPAAARARPAPPRVPISSSVRRMRGALRATSPPSASAASRRSTARSPAMARRAMAASRRTGSAPIRSAIERGGLREDERWMSTARRVRLYARIASERPERQVGADAAKAWDARHEARAGLSRTRRRARPLTAAGGPSSPRGG